MPFIRTSKGAKIPFSSAKVSEYISIAYREVYNKSMFKYRSEISAITKNVIINLEKQYGNEETSEWLHLDILKEIHLHLGRNTERMDVFYAFDDFYKEESSPAKTIDKTQTLSGFKKRSQFDPAWNFYIRRLETKEEFELRVKQGIGRGEDVSGYEVRERRGLINIKRSQWIKFWETFSLESGIPLNIDLLQNHIVNDRNTYSFYNHDWFNFWENKIFSIMEQDVRNFGLIGAMSLRKMRYDLIGGNIFMFSGLGIENYYDEKEQIKSDFFNQSNIQNTYAELFIQFINQLTFSENMKKDLLSGFDINWLSKQIKPERDQFLDWRAIQKLKQSGALNNIVAGTKWKLNQEFYTVNEDCHELIQWMYMRLSMALASEIKDPKEKNLAALKFYNSFSLQKIIPTAGMLREAGKAMPNYMEDKAIIVADRYENIWESINETAVGTKWTGSVSLDWREVRAKNSPIKKGIRESGGVLPFLETINTSLNAQDREPDDKPVTNIIPLYHKDVEFLLTPEKHQFPRFNVVISIPDLFMEKAKKAEDWFMFDPKIFPEILSGDENAYLIAESKIKERAKLYPKSYKRKRADKIMKKLISNLNKGFNHITFENNQRAFNLFNKQYQFVNGVEGVGAFSVHKNTENGHNLFSHWAKWPSIAVNISQIVDDSGAPNVAELKDILATSLQIMESVINSDPFVINAGDNNQQIMRKRDLLDFRNACIGIIGFNEVVKDLQDKKVILNDEALLVWVRALFSSFQMILLSEEQKLVKQLGAADIYNSADLGKSELFFNPEESIKKLRESRNGSVGLSLSETEIRQWVRARNTFKANGHRFVSKTLYAPFEFSASLAGVSHGGMGGVSPIEKVLNDKGEIRYIPTPILLNLTKGKNDLEIKALSKTLKYPTKYKIWKDELLKYSNPAPEDLRRMLRISGAMRPFLDHGVCFTMPEGLTSNEATNLLEQSWFYGISSIRTKSQHADKIVPNEDHEILEDDDDLS